MAAIPRRKQGHWQPLLAVAKGTVHLSGAHRYLLDLLYVTIDLELTDAASTILLKDEFTHTT